MTFHKTRASQGEDLEIEYKWSDATIRADCARLAEGVVMERLLSARESTIMFDPAGTTAGAASQQDSVTAG